MTNALLCKVHFSYLLKKETIRLNFEKITRLNRQNWQIKVDKQSIIEQRAAAMQSYLPLKPLFQRFLFTLLLKTMSSG
jgi:hypothetical protein